MKIKLREKKGVIVLDAIIATMIILLFAGLTISLIYNIVLESSKAKISSQQMDFAIEIFEYAEKLTYKSVDQDNLESYINSKNLDYVSAGKTEDIDSLTTPYKIGIKVEKYNEIDGNEDKEDIIKKITLTIENEIAGKPFTTEISTLKKATIKEAEDIINK